MLKYLKYLFIINIIYCSCPQIIDSQVLYEDDCGDCFGENADMDCNGDCGLSYGAAYYDDCGVCSGGYSGHLANSDQDCNGDCFGSAVIKE